MENLWWCLKTESVLLRAGVVLFILNCCWDMMVQLGGLVKDNSTAWSDLLLFYKFIKFTLFFILWCYPGRSRSYWSSWTWGCSRTPWRIWHTWITWTFWSLCKWCHEHRFQIEFYIAPIHNKVVERLVGLRDRERELDREREREEQRDRKQECDGGSGMGVGEGQPKMMMPMHFSFWSILQVVMTLSSITFIV